MIGIVSKFLGWFRSAFEQEAFESDWYGWATNQTSHMTFGAASAFVFSSVWFYTFGEFPFKIVAASIIAAVYIFFEVIRGWFGWDSIEDTLFFALYGSGGALVVFSEVKPGEDTLIVSTSNVVPILMVVSVHLASGILSRMRR